MLCGKRRRQLEPPGRHFPSGPHGRMPLPPLSPEQLDQAALFRSAHRADLRVAVRFDRDQPSLFPALAGGQRLRCRADRRDPGGADVPARRHDAVRHRLCRPGERPRQRAAGAGRRGTGDLLRVISCRRPTASCWRLAGAVGRVDAARAAGRFAGAVGRAAVRLELYRHAHLGLDLVPRANWSAA